MTSSEGNRPNREILSVRISVPTPKGWEASEYLIERKKLLQGLRLRLRLKRLQQYLRKQKVLQGACSRCSETDRWTDVRKVSPASASGPVSGTKSVRRGKDTGSVPYFYFWSTYY